MLCVSLTCQFSLSVSIEEQVITRANNSDSNKHHSIQFILIYSQWTTSSVLGSSMFIVQQIFNLEGMVSQIKAFFNIATNYSMLHLNYCSLNSCSRLPEILVLSMPTIQNDMNQIFLTSQNYTAYSKKQCIIQPYGINHQKLLFRISSVLIFYPQKYSKYNRPKKCQFF